jgi:dTDP-4-dehydrorhamnose reductase
MNVLVTGGKGQLGRSLVARGATGMDIDELDICDARSVEHVSQFDLVINAAAYTAVDKAESERERAFAINRDGAALVASACARHQVRLLHVSTDYVFDGSATHPYSEEAPLAPLGAYGASKAEGDAAVRSAGGTVVRTSWLFGEGGPSFVHTILRLAMERPVLRVVADQHGCPTYVGDLADALLALGMLSELAPAYHFCNSGPTTWHTFAGAIVDEARRYTTLRCERIDPIRTSEYPTLARRPAYSVLDTSRIRATGIVPPSWRPGLTRVVANALQE